MIEGHDGECGMEHLTRSPYQNEASVSNELVTNLGEGRDGEMGVVEVCVEEEPEVCS